MLLLLVVGASNSVFAQTAVTVGNKVTDASSLVSGNSYLIKYTSMTGTPYIYDAGTTTPLQAPSVQNAAPKSCAFYFISDATNYYSLGRKNNEIGFYKFTGGTITLGANKAYLETPAPGGAVKGFVLGFNDLVGVDKIHSEEAKDAVLFNLAGQRVAQPSQRGVYIVGGKKVVVK
jgi:hypothetical protein